MGRSIRREASPSLLQDYSATLMNGSRLADASNPTFRPLHTALDKRYRELHAQGVGTKRKQVEVVSNHEERQLCSGTSTLLVQNCYYPEFLKYHVYCLCTFCYPQLMWSLSMYNTCIYAFFLVHM